MINQLQEHNVVAFRAKQRVFSKAIEEPLCEVLCRQNTVSSGITGHVGREDIFKIFSALLVTNIAVKPVITDSLKSLWQEVLHHSSYESQGRDGFMFDLSGFVVTIPVADRTAVIFFDSTNGDGRGYNIFCQIFRQSLSVWRHITFLQESDKTFWVISPCFIDILLDGRITDLSLEHSQEVVLPFSVHHVIGDVGDRFPFAVFVNSTCGHEDVEVWIVMTGTSGGLKYNDVSDVEIGVGAGIEDVFEAGMSCPHEGTEQFWISKEPKPQELRHCQYDMPIGDLGQQASSDEVSPSVGIDLCTGKTEAGFTGEGNAAYLAARAAAVLNKSHFVGIAAVEHFTDGVVVVRTIKTWMGMLKRIPVIIENLLECVFINAFHGSSLRTTIPEMAQ